MARGAFAITKGRFFGWVAAFVVATLLLGPVVAVFVHADSINDELTGEWATVRFTLVQAILSAFLSVALAIPVARALARRRFVGRGVLITLLGAPFILPVIVAVLGLLAVFGRGGVLNSALGWAGVEPISIYGLQGVVLAHVFFNLPLATRIILQGWQGIPGERFRLAASLDMAPRDVFRTLEWPMLWSVLPGAAMVIFALCLSSFAVALTLGGGPRATTIELAIYQAFRFDFDLGRAAMLALLQLVLAGGAAALALWVAVPMGFGAGLDRVVRRWESDGATVRVLDGGVIVLAALFLILPLTMVVLSGLAGLAKMPAAVYSAAGVSVLIALMSTCVTMVLALGLAQRAEIWGYLGLAISPMVVGTGLFLLINPVADPMALALPVIVMVNALMALPFSVRVLGPELRAIETDFGRLADALGMAGWARMRWLYLPRLRRPMGFSAGLAAALSMGDLGVVTLFAATDWATLPLQMYRLMGAYRMEAAAGAGLLLLALSLLLFWFFDRGGRVDVDA
ncbi:thiamine/thiamine pyrophosphate ABC transporter permease ThiP [Alisedimentitalea sp. MJ-SS2]|uniref:thiamine/thiamine pyrophosphate ABC transporter permease ThiP n=1 Tax=Aliisedimentitalea sp. MJ-SS2 TaxID=3049795 RepID=UPI002906C5C0|nr:thiamine/thiamine pyrophosphate ABC transporter permease ThiP [Alisedimentitalea sp. MJ-SS2]MDU8927706.1 thiamine/thiamine pyrophosphate ABC transporter permease ThiP [Alisedimentitalea sp. MJ-SS2]